MPPTIRIPVRLHNVLTHSPYASVVTVLCEQASIVMQGVPEFFPEYTDHTGQHVNDVLSTIDRLIPQAVFDAEVLNAKDIACLVSAAVLHDIGMHITRVGFIDLMKGAWDKCCADLDEPSWPTLWSQYIRAVLRYDDRTLLKLLGPQYLTLEQGVPVIRDPMKADPSGRSWTEADKRVIGDFVRRYHPRLAHDIALGGFPGAGHAFPLIIEDPPAGLGHVLADVSGLIARSHGIDLRRAADLARHTDADAVRQHEVAIVFHMALLRLADYLQLDHTRAPTVLMHLLDIQSPLSILEWSKHKAVDRINWGLVSDPLAIQVHIQCRPKPAHRLSTHLSLRSLLVAVQHEFDTAGAVLREAYGNGADEKAMLLSISKSRIVSNLDDNEVLSKLPYQAQYASFTTAGPDLLRMLISPLYGNHPAPGLRELMQNAMDAVNELRDLRANDTTRGVTYYESLRYYDLGSDSSGNAVDVRIALEQDESGKWWCVCTDRGVGMSPSTVRDYYLKAGASFRNSSTWREQHQLDNGLSRVTRAGRFGVGAFAMFLLCETTDVVEVTTKHCFEARGITLRGSLDMEPLEFEWHDDAPTGTRIRVPLKDSVVRVLISGDPHRVLSRDECWDWSASSQLVVQRYRGEELLRQRRVWPCDPARLDGETWRMVKERDDLIAMWTWPRLIDDDAAVACNGVVISGSSTAIGYHDGAARWSPSMSPPNVNIIDQRASLPITVTRSRIDELLDACLGKVTDAAARDVVAYFLVMLPEAPTLNERGYFISGPGGEYDHVAMAATSGGWLYAPDTYNEVLLERDCVLLDPYVQGAQNMVNALYQRYDVIRGELNTRGISPAVLAYYSRYTSEDDIWKSSAKDDGVVVRRDADSTADAQIEGLKEVKRHLVKHVGHLPPEMAYVERERLLGGKLDAVHIAWRRTCGTARVPFQREVRRKVLAHAFDDLAVEVARWEKLRNGEWRK